jgi:glutamyl-Q tRNA(Asp) synthetase
MAGAGIDHAAGAVTRYHRVVTTAIVTRFAPSPTGYLHLGHAYAALVAWQAARRASGRFLLRLEDIDRTRCRAEFSAAIVEDLSWLGLAWDGEVCVQSKHFADYHAALARLEAKGVLYPCFCTRAAIKAEMARAASAPHGGEGPTYPGTCRSLTPQERERRMTAGESFALRLDAARALALTGSLSWEDDAVGSVAAEPLSHGDVILARKDAPASYHLAVTVDDALQGVTLVTRGEDLFAATHVHRLLQALLDLPTPRYRHHRLLADASGRRLAKRDRALTLRALREAGRAPAEVRGMAGFPER